MKALTQGVGVVLALCLFAGVAQAGPVYGFRCITNNTATGCAIGQAQLTVEVVSEPSNQVGFIFRNKVGGQPSSITDIYFEDGALLAIASIVNGPGVSFSQGATPPNLPGGDSISPPFQTTSGFSADSDPPVQKNGVNPGEWVKIIFSLKPGKTYNDVLTAIAQGRTNPQPNQNTSLRIGIHVQGFPGGGSESFILVPEPGFYGLLGLGLAGLLLAARRRRTA